MKSKMGLSSVSRLAATLLFLPVGILHASTIYTFSGTGTAFVTTNGTVPAEPLSFQLTAATFINPPLDGPFSSDVEFTCSQLDSSTNCGLDIFFSNQSGSPSGYSADLQFDAADDTAYIFYFPTGAFAAPGVYAADNGGPKFNLGTLTVTETPEPNTLLLALTGVAGMLVLAGIRAKSFKGITH
jgi:hypothetical protein